MKKLIPVALLMIFSHALNAQSVQIEIDKGYEFLSIDTISDNGFVLLTKTKKDNGKANEYRYRLYDEDMAFVEEERFNIPKYTYSGFEVETKEYNHRLFSSLSRKLTIRSESKTDFEFVDVEVQMPKKTGVASMIIEGDFAWFSMLSNKEWGMFKVNWRTGENVFYPVKVEGAEDVRITSIQLIPSGGIFAFVRSKLKKGYEHYAVLLSSEGEQLESYLIAHEQLLTVKVTEIESNNFLFVGTYSFKSLSESEGLIITTSSNGVVTSEKVLNYADIPDFTKLGGKGSSEGYFVPNHDIIKTKSGYLVTGLVHYPVGHNNHNGNYVFEYDQFTHGFVCVMGEEGEISWSGAFDNWFTFKRKVERKMLLVNEVDSDTYNLWSITNGAKAEVDLSNETITIIPSDEVVDEPNMGIGYEYTEEKVETDNGKRVVVTVTKILE
jgi:hypothetical protein